ncbi:hypothetical protein [Spirosoma sordidisoli]|uniref:DUF1983 domain-containing protein n=1 Tax=Spirosoma sordidisoli TaxID=2502893 RepID=A0A4V1RWN1_9BACT|nr:hypothetical protein [Spirosoma sordidisoli]RYC70848.1 hypothetical protein EQG79_01470 [Spirosoma sordidisoli]
MRNRVHYLILFLLLSLPALAQENFSWSGIAGTIIEKNVTINDAWTGTPTAQAYYRPGGSLIPTSQQPVVTKIADKLYVRFNATKSMAERTYIVISTGATVRYTGYLTLTIGTIPPTTGGGTGTGTVTVAGVQGLSGALNERVAVTAYQQDRDQLVNLINQRATAQQVNAIQQTATSAISRVSSLSGVLAARVQTKTTIRAMNAINTPMTPDVIDVKGVGGGTYYLDPADTSTPDNTGTVLVTANGLRYKLMQAGPVSIEQFGVTYNDFGKASANTAALIRALASGRELTAQASKVYTAGSVTAVTGTTIRFNGNGVIFEHITQNDLFNFANGVSGSIQNVNINAGINMTGLDAVALRIKCQPGRQPGIVLRDVKVSRAGGDIEWGKGIIIIDPDNAVVSDVTIDGRGDASLGSTVPTFNGLEVTCTRAAVSGVFRNVKVYSGGLYGVFVRSPTIAGLEGMKWTECDVVGMDYGYDIESTADFNVYIPTQLTFVNNHAEVKKRPFRLRNFIQATISNCLFYVLATPSRLGTGMELLNTSQVNVQSTGLYNTGNGPMYGIIVGGEGTIDGTLRDITISQGTGSSSNAAIILFPTANKCFLDNIRRTGGSSTVVNQGSNNVIGRTFNAGILE